MKRLSEKRKRDWFKRVLYRYENPNCQICGGKARDVHHIVFRSQGGKTEDGNLISLCRSDHDRAHFKKRPYFHKYDFWKIKGLNLEKMREKYLLARSGCKTK